VKVCVLSDTHGKVHEAAWSRLHAADVVIHAGDLGPAALLNQFTSECTQFEAVSGNADPRETLLLLPEYKLIDLKGYRILLLHIVGRPGKYVPRALGLQKRLNPDMIICGHSHIPLVAPMVTGGLHVNPGAAGHLGFHTQCTLIEFQLEGKRISELQLVELGRRGTLSEKVG
jgi:uncharacterized protein